MTCCCKIIKYKFRNYLKFAVTKTEVHVSSDRFYFNISSSLKEHDKSASFALNKNGKTFSCLFLTLPWVAIYFMMNFRRVLNLERSNNFDECGLSLTIQNVAL